MAHDSLLGKYHISKKAFSRKKEITKNSPSSHRSGICIQLTTLHASPDAWVGSSTWGFLQ